jgi:hypothetical protein
MKDKTPDCVKAVLDKPGKYRFDGKAYYWFFEVTENREVHQLNSRTMERDGYLSPDGWNPSARKGKVTPL